MTTTYHGGEQIDQAQTALDRHAVSSADGLCVTCEVLGPCQYNEAAAGVFALSARLPQRRPGATRPELLGARRTDFRWLTSGSMAQVYPLTAGHGTRREVPA